MNQLHEKSTVTNIQGMFCCVKGEGSSLKCTVSMADICLTVYSEVKLFEFDMVRVHNRVPGLIRSLTDCKAMKVEDLISDLEDLLDVTSKVQKTVMSLRSGDKIQTYALGHPEYDEKTGYLYLCPLMPEWWEHPKVKPIVESLQAKLPGFAPWKMQGDSYIKLLSARSALMS